MKFILQYFNNFEFKNISTILFFKHKLYLEKTDKHDLKMKLNLSPEELLSLTKISTCLTVCWPPSVNDSKSKIFILDRLCLLSFLSSILLLLPLLNSVYQDWGDPLVISKSICLSCAVSQVAMKIAVCRIQRHRFQV